MEVLYAALGIVGFLALWAALEGPGRRARARRPVYHVCRAGHRHQTPAAAGRCSRAQARP